MHTLPDGDEKDILTWEASENDYADLEQPEPYMILLLLRSTGIPYWMGGLADQPYLLMKEINAAVSGEARFQEYKDNRKAQQNQGIGL